MSKIHTLPAQTEIDTDAVARGLAAKAYIVELQGKDPDGSTEPAPCLLSNINQYLDTLAGLAPKSEYFASNGIVTSLGYYIVNQLLWAYRAANKAVGEIPTMEDDGYEYPAASRTTQAHVEEIGFQELPRFEALHLLGAYKTMVHMQKGSAYHADFPTKSATEILGEMIVGERQAELDRAYAAIGNAEIAKSRAAAAIQHAMKAQAERRPVFTERNKQEIAYVQDTIKAQRPEMLTDDAWNQIPIWVQYKLTMTVFNQVLKAIAYDTVLNPAGTYLRTELITLSDIMMLELEAAAKHRDIKLAFALGRLSERHVIETTVIDVSIADPKTSGPVTTLQ